MLQKLYIYAVQLLHQGTLQKHKKKIIYKIIHQLYVFVFCLLETTNIQDILTSILILY